MTNTVMQAEGLTRHYRVIQGLMKQALTSHAVANSAERRLNRQSKSQASPAKGLPQGPQPIGLEVTARVIQPELFRRPFQVSRHA